MKPIITALFLSACALNGFAAQIKTVRNYEDISIKASIKEPNSIMLEEDRILQIKAPGNTLVDGCNGRTNCKLIDDATGILTFLPAPLYHTRPFTINLLTEKGLFYNVRVEPKPIPSQTIVFKIRKKAVIRAQEPKTSGYEKSLVRFIRALVNERVPEGFTQTIPKSILFYKSSTTQLKRLVTVTGNQLTGEVFELKNATNRPLILREASFNWPGTKAIALAKTQLMPYETTRLYRIS